MRRLSVTSSANPLITEALKIKKKGAGIQAIYS